MVKEKLEAAVDTREVASLLHGGHFVTSHGGSVYPLSSVELFVRDKANFRIGSNIVLPLTEETEEDLLSQCNPLTCGVNYQEVYEPKYRKALGLNSNQFFHNFELQSTILEDIRAALWPHNNVVLTAWPGTLSVYTTGGYFKSHTDHERGKTHFGTLVLVLPSTFEGGQLVVSAPGSGGQSVTYDWSENTKWEFCLLCLNPLLCNHDNWIACQCLAKSTMVVITGYCHLLKLHSPDDMWCTASELQYHAEIWFLPT